MILRLVWENVRFRPMRTMLSILLIAVPVTLILTLIGLSHGFLDDSKKRASGVGADIIIRPKGSSYASFSGNMPDKLVEIAGQQPHVIQATGVIIQPLGGFDSLTGVDPVAFDRMSGGLRIREGHGLRDEDDMLIDDLYAAQKKLKSGRKVTIANHEWTIAGIVDSGKMSHMFVKMPVLQQLVAATGKVSQIYVRVDNEENIDAAETALKNTFVDYPVHSMKEWRSLISVDNIPMLGIFINVVIGIGVVIGFTVVSLSMYMAVLQRTREIGILKSLGATNAFIMRLIMWEAFVMGIGGTIFGILLSFAARAIMTAIVPASLPVAIVYTWWPIAGGIALGAALLGALYPGTLAVRQDPIEALAYE